MLTLFPEGCSSRTRHRRALPDHAAVYPTSSSLLETGGVTRSAGVVRRSAFLPYPPPFH